LFSARSTNPKEVQKALKIAVNDAIDSDEGESEIAPFKNILNEMYARRYFKKIRSSHRLRGSMGEPLS